MSAQSTSPRSSEVAADQPKDRIEPLLDAQATSQDANHSDPVTAVTTVTAQSPGDIDSAAPEASIEAPQSPQSETSQESQESGEASPVRSTKSTDDEPSAPPLPNEPPPATEDDGWDFHWDATSQAYFFYNRFTHETTWENPRLRSQASSSNSTSQARADVAAAPPAPPGLAEPPKNERPPAGGYNPAIHGDYDPNAWYAKGGSEDNASSSAQDQAGVVAAADTSAAAYAAMGTFNRFTGRWQAADGAGADQGVERHSDESKSRRQMNAFFDVDAAANSHDGRSLKAERSGKKPTKAELKQFKEKRRAKKEEKRRAWLRD
ncbi:hypothetical protein F4820DRAFT_406685 [Hypoxylon rubiginosum]|uniref:Uncharacterized protein n=1 Tax=Hypoxylon rubiginosum TaxID=110542 RepID=A0ACB9ZEP5_9PEZI|nr:hypothetical protein F4820DRAFT_406685 [Hypoxylon rubiginosum]